MLTKELSPACLMFVQGVYRHNVDTTLELPVAMITAGVATNHVGTIDLRPCESSSAAGIGLHLFSARWAPLRLIQRTHLTNMSR